jgi:hypothetical protein
VPKVLAQQLDEFSWSEIKFTTQYSLTSSVQLDRWVELCILYTDSCSVKMFHRQKAYVWMTFWAPSPCPTFRTILLNQKMKLSTLVNHFCNGLIQTCFQRLLIMLPKKQDHSSHTLYFCFLVRTYVLVIDEIMNIDPNRQ